jgi:hypothetical protein
LSSNCSLLAGGNGKIQTLCKTTISRKDKKMDTLLFFKSPAVTIATNTFVNVPVILQFEDTPLIEVVRTEVTEDKRIAFTTQIPIYHPDGTYLAKAVGSRLFTTKEGEKAGLVLRYPKNMTVCELEGKTLFEIHRQGAAAISAHAELYTPEGAFVKCPASLKPQLFLGGTEIKIGGVTMIGNTFAGVRIGIWMRKDGSLAIGVS